MASNGLAQHLLDAERRRSERDEVFYRTAPRLADGTRTPIDIVNLSRTGFMARSEAQIAEGTRLRIKLPVIGEVEALVVWALGGRIGAEFRVVLDSASYFNLLAAMPRGK